MDSESHYVLIVDDNQDVCATIRDVLAVEGYTCATAAHGNEALAFLRSHPRPALVLLDWMMPICDGPTFRQAQLADPSIADIPVVFLSAGVGAQATVEARHGAGYLAKPFTLNELLAVVQRYCEPTL